MVFNQISLLQDFTI